MLLKYNVLFVELFSFFIELKNNLKMTTFALLKK